MPDDTTDRMDEEPTPAVIAADASAPPAEIVRRGYFGSFAHADFRLFWLGALASNIGTWMQSYALGIVVFSFRRSEFDLGLVNFLSGIPILFLALPAGVLADHVDRRKLLMGIQVVLLLQATALGVLYKTGSLTAGHASSSLAWVASLGLLGGAFIALQGPAFQSMVPDLVPHSLLMNAIALNSAQFQGARLLGPLVAAGLVLVGADMGDVFLANAVSFLFVIAALQLMKTGSGERPIPVATGSSRRRDNIWAAVTAGIRYARENQAVRVLLVSTAFVTVFGFPYMVLLPAIVSETLRASAAEYARWTAFIMAANGLGALVGALVVAGLPATFRRNRAIPFCIMAFAGTVTVFALARTFWLAACVSTLAGAVLIAAHSFTNTSVQAAAPGPIRGRVMSLYVMAFMGMMPISGLLSGVVGELTGPSVAVVIGAVALAAWGLLLVVRSDWLDESAPTVLPSDQ